jgi:hypothetical protein
MKRPPRGGGAAPLAAAGVILVARNAARRHERAPVVVGLVVIGKVGAGAIHAAGVAGRRGYLPGAHIAFLAILPLASWQLPLASSL